MGRGQQGERITRTTIKDTGQNEGGGGGGGGRWVRLGSGGWMGRKDIQL